MEATSDMVTASEAAVLAGIGVRDVHRAFDERILPASLLGDEGGRQVARVAVPLLAFYFRTAEVLHADARRMVIHSVVLEGRTGPLHRARALRRRRRPFLIGDGITVDLAVYVSEIDERARRVAQARAMVVQDPDILGGSEPVIRGTRVPVYDVAASVAVGIPHEEILTSYPSLTGEQVELAALYASAEPPRGRPRRRLAERLPAGARLVSSGRVARPSVASPQRPEMPAA